MDKNLNILLTGGSGVLGSELKQHWKNLEAPCKDKLDIRDGSNVKKYFEGIDPDIIIHAAAMTNNREVELDPVAAIETNVSGTINMVRASLSSESRFVYISTDYVYPGIDGNYAEDDPVLPFNLYAWTKLAGEAVVKKLKNYLIIRTSFSPVIFPYEVAFSDKWASKEYVDELVPEILKVSMSSVIGTINLGGERASIYDFAARRSPNIREISIKDSEFKTPKDTSLNLQKWFEFKQLENNSEIVTECRICNNSKLVSYLDLGMMPLANGLMNDAQATSSVEKFNLNVLYCTKCSLSQLSTVIEPKKMFCNYPYRTSINIGFVGHCRDMAISLGKRFDLKADDLVLDIAGNDGTLLNEFKNILNVNVLNIDAAQNITKISRNQGIKTINAFWSLRVAKQILSDFSKPKLIIATNVLAHVDDIKNFLLSVKVCLSEDGIFVAEFPYCVDLIENNEFDTIYFEHLSYFLIKPLNILAKSVGMKIFDAEKFDIHGGTLRVLMSQDLNYSVTDSVKNFSQYESAKGFYNESKYIEWSKRINTLIEDLIKNLTILNEGGAKIAAFGASAKGNTLLNSCGFDHEIVKYIVDDTPEKIGKFSPGTGIPIVSREMLEVSPPDYLLILAWNCLEDIMKTTSDFKGKYIVPIPKFQVLE